jgi:hypothetical protein
MFEEMPASPKEDAPEDEALAIDNETGGPPVDDVQAEDHPDEDFTNGEETPADIEASDGFAVLVATNETSLAEHLEEQTADSLPQESEDSGLPADVETAASEIMLSENEINAPAPDELLPSPSLNSFTISEASEVCLEDPESLEKKVQFAPGTPDGRITQRRKKRAKASKKVSGFSSSSKRDKKKKTSSSLVEIVPDGKPLAEGPDDIIAIVEGPDDIVAIVEGGDSFVEHSQEAEGNTAVVVEVPESSVAAESHFHVETTEHDDIPVPEPGHCSIEEARDLSSGIDGTLSDHAQPEVTESEDQPITTSDTLGNEDTTSVEDDLSDLDNVSETDVASVNVDGTSENNYEESLEVSTEGQCEKDIDDTPPDSAIVLEDFRPYDGLEEDFDQHADADEAPVVASDTDTDVRTNAGVIEVGSDDVGCGVQLSDETPHALFDAGDDVDIAEDPVLIEDVVSTGVDAAASALEDLTSTNSEHTEDAVDPVRGVDPSAVDDQPAGMIDHEGEVKVEEVPDVASISVIVPELLSADVSPVTPKSELRKALDTLEGISMEAQIGKAPGEASYGASDNPIGETFPRVVVQDEFLQESEDIGPDTAGPAPLDEKTTGSTPDNNSLDVLPESPNEHATEQSPPEPEPEPAQPPIADYVPLPRTISHKSSKSKSKVHRQKSSTDQDTHKETPPSSTNTKRNSSSNTKASHGNSKSLKNFSSAARLLAQERKLIEEEELRRIRYEVKRAARKAAAEEIERLAREEAERIAEEERERRRRRREKAKVREREVEAAKDKEERRVKREEKGRKHGESRNQVREDASSLSKRSLSFFGLGGSSRLISSKNAASGKRGVADLDRSRSTRTDSTRPRDPLTSRRSSDNGSHHSRRRRSSLLKDDSVPAALDEQEHFVQLPPAIEEEDLIEDSPDVQIKEGSGSRGSVSHRTKKKHRHRHGREGGREHRSHRSESMDHGEEDSKERRRKAKAPVPKKGGGLLGLLLGRP